MRTNEQTLWSRLEDFHNLTPYLKTLYFVQSLVTTYSQELLLYHTRFWTTAIFLPRAQRWRLWVKGAIKRLLRKTLEEEKKWRWAALLEEWWDQKEKNQLKISFIMEQVIITFLIIKYREDLTGRQCHTYQGAAGYQRFLGDRPTFTFWHFGVLEIIQNGQIEAKGLNWLDMEMF